MSTFKKIFLIVLALVDVFALVETIGYLIMGINTPTSLAGRNLFFTGAYILALVYFLLFVIITIIFIICLIKWKNKVRKKDEL